MWQVVTMKELLLTVEWLVLYTLFKGACLAVLLHFSLARILCTLSSGSLMVQGSWSLKVYSMEWVLFPLNGISLWEGWGGSDGLPDPAGIHTYRMPGRHGGLIGP